MIGKRSILKKGAVIVVVCFLMLVAIPITAEIENQEDISILGEHKRGWFKVEGEVQAAYLVRGRFWPFPCLSITAFIAAIVISRITGKEIEPLEDTLRDLGLLPPIKSFKMLNLYIKGNRNDTALTIVDSGKTYNYTGLLTLKMNIGFFDYDGGIPRPSCGHFGEATIERNYTNLTKPSSNT